MDALSRQEQIQNANQLLADERWQDAIIAHVRLMLRFPEIRHVFQFGLRLAQRRFKQARHRAERPRVAVICWEMSHNPAGRAVAIAELYRPAAETHLVGCLFPRWGKSLWAPLADIDLPCHLLSIEENWDEASWESCASDFWPQAVAFVLQHPFDLVHLIKPRGPNLVFALLYRWIWQAQVIQDVDDEELAFFNQRRRIDELDDGVAAWLEQHVRLPHLAGLTRKQWTYFSVGLVRQFPSVTVSNPALQQRYGGRVIPHVRRASDFADMDNLRREARVHFGVSEAAKVVLFFGTPRAHKGLRETVAALAQLNDPRVVYVIVGNFPEPEFKAELELLAQTSGVAVKFFGNQPFAQIPQVVALGDIAINLQDTESPVAHYQVPAKLTDALASGLIVLATETPALADFFAAKAIVPVSEASLVDTLARYLTAADAEQHREHQRQLGLDYFQHHLAAEVYAGEVQNWLECMQEEPAQVPVFDALLQQLLVEYRPHDSRNEYE
ncbi:MAG: glycosyltransferase [Aliidiomarina sp.]|uniref:glycosyltransferase n=1 Tax=Aliidiomarina sp. TaxID=1872439 RepID=UPI0025B9D107|nr:glycosyltransferase [Aliidiomarina sp.]MCH8502452.1 glycosyltransferase [Aliidiomarina sp.]